MKLWAGRFQKETDTLVNDFNSSITFDARMYKEDIAGSIAHAAKLGKQGIIEAHEAEKIIEGLNVILADIDAGQVEFSLENEDIHMNIETMLTQRIGDTGKRLHTARSRNDQVAVDFRLYVKQEIPKIINMVLELERVLVKKAEANLETVMPGYTHLQRAQPTTFAHYMMAYANMLRRDVSAWTNVPWARGLWPPPPIRWTGSRLPPPWASKSLPTTPWTRCLTGTSPLSFCPPVPS